MWPTNFSHCSKMLKYFAQENLLMWLSSLSEKRLKEANTSVKCWQILACAIAFMWSWNEHTGKTEIMVFVAKSDLRSDLRVYNSKFLMVGPCPGSTSRCVLRMHWMCPCCGHVTCSFWLWHWLASNTTLKFMTSTSQCLQMQTSEYVTKYQIWTRMHNCQSPNLYIIFSDL